MTPVGAEAFRCSEERWREEEDPEPTAPPPPPPPTGLKRGDGQREDWTEAARFRG